MNIKIEGLLSSHGLRVLDLDNLECGDIDLFKLPYSIDADGEKVVYDDQWSLWLEYYNSSASYYKIDERKIIVAKPL